jgi:anti-sigma factor RsiW
MMISCDELTSTLAECLDGAASPRRARLIEQHLEACPACRREVENERELRAAFALLHRPAMPGRLRDRILAATVASPEGRATRLSRRALTLAPWRAAAAAGGGGRRRGGFSLRAFAAAAAVVVAVVAATWFGPRLLERTSPERRVASAPSLAAAPELSASAARAQAREGLELALRIISRAESATLLEVLGEDVPRAVRSSYERATRQGEGGRG